MRTSYSLLKKYVSFSLEATDLSRALTMKGLEVEKQINYGQIGSEFIIGKVLTKTKHPQSEKLFVCQIDIQKEILQIICGASHFQEGDCVVVATIGTKLPGGMLINKKTLKGVDSYGMLCSSKELGLFDSEGVWILPSDAVIGSTLQPYLPEEDTIFDLAITPNRGDALSTIGIAREVSMIVKKPLKLPVFEISEQKTQLPLIEIKTDKCLRYSIRVIHNIKVQESPLWLKIALKKYGISSINNIVDFANYVMMETGQPLHIFDLEKLKGSHLSVELLDQTEEMQTITHQKVTLPEGSLVIKNDHTILALAGIIGSSNSGVGLNTHSILIESAYFNTDVIRSISQKMNLSTDASYRFTRDTDINMIPYALDFVTSLICEETQGQASQMGDLYPKIKKNNQIIISKEWIDQKLGFSIPLQEIESIFSQLNFKNNSTRSEHFELTIPSYRNDCSIKEDIVEEVIRVYGYENLPSHCLKINLNMDHLPKSPLIFELKDLLVAIGLEEVYHFSFLKKEMNQQFSPQNTQMIEVQNPLNQDLTMMRSTLLAGYIQDYLQQHKVGKKNWRQFETGHVFQLEKDSYKEELHLGILLSGNAQPFYHEKKSEKVTYFHLKGILDYLLKALHRKNIRYQRVDTNHSFLHPHKSAFIYDDQQYLGYIGELHSDFNVHYQIAEEIFFLEINLSLYEESQYFIQKPSDFALMSKYPLTIRDFCFIVDASLLTAEIIQDVYSVSPLIKDVKLIDVYQDPKRKDQKSVTFSCLIQSDVKTLVEKEIILLSEDLVSFIEKKYVAKLRDY